MMVRVHARLAVIQVIRWDPCGATGFELAGGPAAAGDQFVVGSAGLGEVVDVGGAALGLVGDVVDFGEIAGHIAAGKRTPAVLCVED
jgi:hypothetical protein